MKRKKLNGGSTYIRNDIFVTNSLRVVNLTIFAWNIERNIIKEQDVPDA